MSYRVQLPNGHAVDVDDDVPPEQARLMLVREFPDLFKRKQGFGPAMAAGWDNAAGAIEGFGADLADKAGLNNVSKGLRKMADKNKEEVAREYEPTTQGDIDAAQRQGLLSGIGALSRKYATEPLGGMVGSLGPSVGGAVVGAASPVPGGAAAGFALPYFAQSAGENMERQRQAAPGEDPKMLNATATALAQTAIGMFGFGKMVNGALGSQLAMREATKLAPQVLSGQLTKEAAVKQLGGTLKNVVAETGAQVGIGAGTNIADEGLRRAQAGQPLGDADALAQYKDIALTSLAPAGLFGVAHGSGAKGHSARVLADAEKKGQGQRQQIAAEQQAGVRESLEAERLASEPPTVAADAQQAASMILNESRRDDAQRAIDTHKQPGVLDPEHPLQMLDTDGKQRRADAEAAFGNAEINDDLLGGIVKMPGEEAPAPERRAAPAAPEADPNQGVLPLQSEFPPPLELTPAPPDAGSMPHQQRTSDPVLTKREDFNDMVYPQAPTYKSGKLDGLDLAQPKDAAQLLGTLKTYLRNVEDNEKNAPRRAALEKKIGELQDTLDATKAQGVLPLKEAKDAAVAANDNHMVDIKEPANGTLPTPEGTGNKSPAVARPDIEDMGVRSEQPSVPDGLPPVERKATGTSDGPAGDVLRAEKPVDDPLTPLQERAKFGRDIGAVVRAGGNYLDSRQNVKLGKAMEASDYQGVVDALAGSKNVMIRHIAEQAANAEGVKVKIADDAETHVVDGVSRNTDNARVNQSLLEAMRKYAADVEASGQIPKGFWNEPVPLMDGHPDVAHIPNKNIRSVFGASNGWINKPESWLKEYKDLSRWNEDSGGDAGVHRHIGNKVEATGVHGTFDPATNTMSALQERSKDEHTVAHEMVHALMHNAIDNPTAEQKPIVGRLKALYEYVRGAMKDDKSNQNWNHGRDYGLKDLHEFVSEAMTNPDFQQKLSKVKYQNTSVWGKFTDYVAKLLGLKNDNAFTEFLANVEGLENTGLKTGTSKGGKKFLGSYADSTTPEIPRGALGSMISGTSKAVKEGGIKGALKNLRDKIEQGGFDIKYGVTRHLERAWTRVHNGVREATANALLQHSAYAPQLGGESLSVGKVLKNSEGLWKIEADSNNLRSFVDAVQALPTEDDKFRVSNGILTNLNYHEREQLLGDRKVNAQKLEAESRKELKDASKMKGAAAARAYRKGRAKLDMALELLDAEYKRPAGVTDETIKQALLDAQTPEVKKMLDIVKAINKQNIDIMEQGGLVSKESADLWREREHYVPMQRIMDEITQDKLALPHGGASTSSVKSFKGSERDVQDITENMIRQRLSLVDAAMRNSANVKALHELLEVDGNPAGVTAYEKRPQGMQNIVTVKEDGQNKFYAVDDPMAFTTFRGLIEDAPQFINALEHVSRLFREAIMLSPDAIARNLMRDTSEVWAFGATNKAMPGAVADIFGKFGKSLPGVVKEGFGNKRHQPHYDVSKFGVTGVKEFTSLQAEREAIIRDQLKKTGVKDWALMADTAINTMGRILKPLQNAAIEGELSPRNHVFKQILERTGSETEAAMAAINTMDFRRRGSWQGITYAKKMIPFFNSSLQGMYKIYRAMGRDDNLLGGREGARRALIIKGMQAAAVSSIYQAIMQEDEDYMRTDKQMRDRNILIPFGEDENGDAMFARIPIPGFEFGSLFWTIPANLIATLSGKQDTRELVEALKGAATNQVPGIIPQAFKPVIEGATNYSFFTGKPLESMSMQRLDPSQRSYDSTSETAKGIGAMTGTSPIKVDNLLKGYFGSLGVVVTQIVDAMLSDGTKASQPWHRAPVIKSMIVDPLSSDYRTRFFELKNTVDQVYTTATRMAKEDPEKARAYLAKETNGVQNLQYFHMHNGIVQMGNQLRKAADYEQKIKASKNSPEMKQQQLTQVRKATNALVEKQMPGLKQMLSDEGDDDDEGDDE